MSPSDWPENCADSIRREVSLHPRTSMKVGGVARVLFEPRTVEELVAFVRFQRRRGAPWLVLGGGTNLLVAASRVETPVVSLTSLRGIERSGSSVEVLAGTKLPRLVRWAAIRGLGGLEGLAGIPGTVGGAIAMNSGGAFGSMADYLESVLVVTAEGVLSRKTKAEIRPGYRSTELEGGIVVSCRLGLDRGDPEELLTQAKSFTLRKARSQPVSLRSAGCIFRNPPGRSAGALIESVGMKGIARGGARISSCHANFIVHDGTASADDVLGLIRDVRASVARQRGVHLELEVKVWNSQSS